MSSPNEHRANVRVGADHPALAGHFPGNPIVPGVVLLDRVAALVETERQRFIRHFAVVKFVAPLRPGESAELTVHVDGSRARFRIEREGQAIVSGEAELA